ncbi:MAG: CocE/NonD family hydrolase [Clostridiales Family XIII bacterium]|jgi:predicted acyl esterase|nr:CocE/NonD family hydrolase [Clostridiales Family XIII bacterium]
MEEIRIMRDAAVPMRDGLKLAANVYLPNAPGKYPVIMAYTGFGKDAYWGPQHDGWGFAYEPWSPPITGSITFEANDPDFWCRCGYAIMLVDPRGFGHSPGTRAVAEIDGAPGEHAIIEQGRWARDQYDAIEWTAVQDWCDGNIALSGVSIFAFSQWRVAGMNPPHLKCINPWEGMTDFHRDCKFPGGIPETKFTLPNGEFCHKMTADIPAWPAPEHEDPPASDPKEEDDFLAEITLPVLISGNWTDHGCHTRGSFRAFRKISSEQKWLYTHGRSKWGTFYSSEARTIRKLFFDCFLKGADDRILFMPKVSLMVMEDKNKFSQRWARDYPIPEAAPRVYWLDAAAGKLTEDFVTAENKIAYNAKDGHAAFELMFKRDTELLGPSGLKLRVSTDEGDDMDIFVTFRKLDTDGNECYLDGWITPGLQPIALGWLKLSHRKLDIQKSTPIEPYPIRVIGEGEKIKPGDIVSCEIPVLPTGILFRTGETLRVEISGAYRSGEALTNPGFEYKSAVNRGTHTIYTGGAFDSRLTLPLHEV